MTTTQTAFYCLGCLSFGIIVGQLAGRAVAIVRAWRRHRVHR